MKEQKAQLIIRYPGRKGFILETHTLQQQIMALFDLSVRVEEHAGRNLDLILNDATIYSDSAPEPSEIDYDRLFRAVSEYQKPLKKRAEVIRNSDDEEDPEDRQWLNSVCSGE